MPNVRSSGDDPVAMARNLRQQARVYAQQAADNLVRAEELQQIADSIEVNGSAALGDDEPGDQS